MLQRFQLLKERISSRFGLGLREPAGQDSYNCQLLAMLDQLSDAQLADALPKGFDVKELRAACRSWLRENGDVIVDGALSDGVHELGMLRDFGSDYDEFVRNGKACGGHSSLIAALAVLSRLVGRHLSVQVRFFFAFARPHPLPLPPSPTLTSHPRAPTRRAALIGSLRCVQIHSTQAAEPTMVKLPLLYAESSGIASLPHVELHLGFDPENHYVSAPRHAKLPGRALDARARDGVGGLTTCVLSAPLPSPPPSPPPTDAEGSDNEEMAPVVAEQLTDEQVQYAAALRQELKLLQEMPQVAPLTNKSLFERGDNPQDCGVIVSLRCCKRGSSNTKKQN